MSSPGKKTQYRGFPTENEIHIVARTQEAVRDLKKILKQQIRQNFSHLSKAGYLHKLASYEYDTDIESEWKIDIVHNQNRNSLMRNLIKVEMGDKKCSLKRLKMDTTLNELYGEMKSNGVTDGILAFQNIPPGMLVAVCDDSRDQHGRFYRGRVIQTFGKTAGSAGSRSDDGDGRRPGSLGIVECELVDEGRVDVFTTDQLYLLATKFLDTPARFFTIKLAGLKRFVDSPKFARVLETMLKTYGYRYSMKILRKEEPDQLEVILKSTKLSASVSVNDYLLSELFKEGNFGTGTGTGVDVDSFLSSKPAKSSIFEDTVVCSVKEGGQVFLCQKSREMDTIEDLLSDAEENFSAYLIVYEGSPEQEKLGVGDICVALHPEDGTAHRCKILSTGTGTETETGTGTGKTFFVDWMDIGLQSEVLASKLVPASFVSPILAEAAPRCKEFQLANIQKVKDWDRVLSVLPPGKEVTTRIVSTDTVRVGLLRARAGEDPPVLVELITYKMGHRGERVVNLNANLIKMGPSVVKPTDDSDDIPRVFSPKKFHLPSGLVHIPMNYPLRNWAARSFNVVERDHIMVQEGDELTFYVSQIISTTDFTIHPWESREAVLNLESQLAEYFKNAEWARHDQGMMSLPPSGSFLVYNKAGGGDYRRAKFIQEEIPDRFGTRHLVTLLLLEKGRYERGEFEDLIRVGQSFPLMSTLSPQGAVGRWKYAEDQLAKLKTSLELTGASKLEIHQNLKSLETKLRSRLEKEFPNVKSKQAVTASVVSVKIDENGRAEFELILKHVQNLKGNDSDSE